MFLLNKSVQEPGVSAGRGLLRALMPCLVFLCALALYAFTLQRGVSWQDSGIFQHRIITGTYRDLGGGALAVVHPWYLTFGRLFVLLFPETWRVWAVNFFSALGAATALLLLARLALDLSGRMVVALLAVCTLGLAQMFWWLATIAEVYTWSLAMLLLEVWLLLRICRPAGRLGSAGLWTLLLLVNGMHASLHNVALLNLPVYGCLWLWQWGLGGGRTICAGRCAVSPELREQPHTSKRALICALACALAWLAGATLLLKLFCQDLVDSGSFAASLKSLLVGDRFGATVLGVGRVNLKLALHNYAISALSMVAPAWLLAVAAWRERGREALFKGALLALTLIHALFWMRYFVPDQATFMLPTLGLLAVWVSIGARACNGRLLLGVLSAGVCLQLGMPLLAVKFGGELVSRVRVLPFRDELRYWALPWKHNEASAQRFALAVEEQLQEGDLLYGDLTAINPLVTARAAGMLGADRWRLISEWSDESESELLQAFNEALSSGRRAYIVSAVGGYAPASLLERFDFVREGVLWRLCGLREGASDPPASR